MRYLLTLFVAFASVCSAQVVPVSFYRSVDTVMTNKSATDGFKGQFFKFGDGTVQTTKADSTVLASVYQLSLKAPIASPTFTGTVSGLTLNFTGNGTFGGNLTVTDYLEVKNNLRSSSSGSTVTPATGSFAAHLHGNSGTVVAMTNNFTNANSKIGRIAVYHYTNAEEAFNLIGGNSDVANNGVDYGGGTSLLNAATRHVFYTAANNTTTTGTVRVRISETGGVGRLTVGATDGVGDGNLFALNGTFGGTVTIPTLTVTVVGTFANSVSVGQGSTAKINIDGTDGAEVPGQNSLFELGGRWVYTTRSSHTVVLDNDNNSTSEFWELKNNSAAAATVFNIVESGRVGIYNSVATEGYGVPAIVDTVVRTGQTASIGATNFTNTGTVGDYEVSFYIYTTTAGAAGTVTFNVIANDGTSSATWTSQTADLTSTTITGKQQGTVRVRLGSGNIQWSTTVSGASGSPQYAFYATAERID